MAELPEDLCEFLRLGRQLEYDARRSHIGKIQLKSLSDVAIATIEVFPESSSRVFGCYESLEGTFHVPVYDLVKYSEDYLSEGLFCWLPTVQAYGTVDAEHSEITIFPGVTWKNIVKRPLTYLDAQWNSSFRSKAKSLLPWLYFPFHLEEREDVLEPYPKTCPVHQTPVTTKRVSGHRLTDLIRTCHLEQWLDARREFPCCGVPLDERRLLHCSDCFEAQQQWVRDAYAAMPVGDATPNAAGFVECPGCRSKFSYRDSSTYLDQIHLRCGTRVNVISPPEG